MIENFDNFLNEKLGVNKDVKKITNLIFDLVMKNLTKLKNEKILIFNNVLQNNYGDLIFFNDILIFNLSDNFNSGIVDQKNKDNRVIFLEIKFNVNIKNINLLKNIINHELTHVIENLYSKELCKEWIYYKKLKIHQLKYKDYKYWFDITHLFYETLYQELRSRTSETYEFLKSKETKDISELKKLILTSPEYLKLKNMTKINPKLILITMKQKYSNYIEILSDLMENVFNKKYTEENFIKFIENIKYKVSKQIKKLLRLPIILLTENSEYIEQYEPDKNILYFEYINENIKK